MAYSDQVIDHYENPRNVGNLDKGAKNVGTGMVGAPACGDVMRLQIQVDDKGIIEDARFKTYGCGSAIASSSLRYRVAKRQKLGSSWRNQKQRYRSRASATTSKVYCSVLAEDAIKAAISDYKGKHGAAEAPGSRRSNQLILPA